MSLFSERTATSADQTALYVRRGAEFVPLSWRQYAAAVERMAAALVRLGVEPGDRVALASPNRFEWLVADLAIHLARGVNVAIHASLSGRQMAYQIVNSGAKVVILAGPEQAEKLAPEAREFALRVKVATFDHCPVVWAGTKFWLLSELAADGSDAEALDVRQRAEQAVGPDDLATILYTSGTTGDPKGVMLSQHNLASNALASVEAFGNRATDLRLTWLPLSHIFARTCDLYTWFVTGGRLALADSPEAAVGNCQQLHPTLMNGVPYFYEKVQRYLTDSGQADVPGAPQKLFGGEMRVLVSGGAPLPIHVARFFNDRGLMLLQGYGMTESSPVITTETQNAQRLGTVGPPIPGVELRISDSGEIQTRGPHVMLGYWNDPEATEAMIDDGWLKTGDLGQVDADGFLRITGRAKELIVTSGGKNIAPTVLEALIGADPLVRQSLVIGDRRNYLTALIVVNLEALKARLAAEGLAAESIEESLGDPRVRSLYRGLLDCRLAEVSRYEQIGNFALLAEPFAVATGELTPTLKLCRGRIAARYAERIEAMYAATEPKCSGD